MRKSAVSKDVKMGTAPIGGLMLSMAVTASTLFVLKIKKILSLEALEKVK